MLDVNGGNRRIAGIAWNLRNGFHDLWIFTLSPDRIFSVKGRIGGLSDEKVRVIGVRAAIGHRQTSRRVKLQRRHDFAFVWKTRAFRMSHTRAQEITALNHDARDHAVEDQSVKKLFALC